MKYLLYVDDTKISYKDPGVVDEVMKELESKLGKMVVNRGKSHTFIGMDIEFIGGGNVKMTINEYIQERMEVYGNEQLKSRCTLGAHDLFEVDERFPDLDKGNSDIFHHTVATLFFVAKRARLDIEPTVSLSCT